jgi:hypothetical protein
VYSISPMQVPSSPPAITSPQRARLVIRNPHATPTRHEKIKIVQFRRLESVFVQAENYSNPTKNDAKKNPI